MAQMVPRMMARVSPASRCITHHFQGYWITGIAPGVVGRQARPVASLAAVLGGNGIGGTIGGGRGSNGGGNSGRGGPEQGPSGGSSGWGRTAALALAGGAFLCGEGAAWAAKKAAAPAEPVGELTVEKVTDMFLNLAGPILTNLGFSGCVGAAAGFALKRVGQFVAFCVGLAFLFIQGLAYTGFITVNWTHVHGSVLNVLDVNKDGKVDANDFKPMVNMGLAALSQGVPSVGGFLAGFVLAIRSF